ncbi:restriction endonuclease subunit S [Candidatus Spongiihabitans sp.]|uniref:restriction endonuclease subunit S n=1 Tax=Candidatus Spongiihabitans sp. TaxID=3101308 RepID=UPI003C6FB9D7
MMSDWETKKLGILLTQRKEQVVLDPDIEYILVTISNKGDVKLREKKKGATICAKNGYIARAGDFIYSRLSVHTGAFGIVPPELDNALITNEMPCFEIDEDQIYPKVLVDLVGLPTFLRQLKQLTKGMGRVRIKESMMLSLSLVLPPLTEQSKLIRKIDHIKTNRSILNTEITHQQTLLKKLRQQILQEAIEGKLTKDWRAENPDVESASELLKRIQAEKAQLIKDKKIKKQKPLPPIDQEEKLFALPNGWKWCRLGEISINSLGKMLDTQKNKGELKPYLRNLNVQWFEINTSNLNEMRFEEHETQKYSVLKGDIVICEGGYPGQAAIWSRNESIMFQKALHRVRFISECFSSVLFVNLLWLWATKGEITKYYTGAGIRHLTGKSLNKMIIPIPPLPEQKAIVAKVEKLLTLCDQLQTQITTNQSHAKQLMQAVLKEAFSQNSQESKQTAM